AKREPVLVGSVVDGGRSDQAGGGRDVLRDDGRVPGDVLADVPGEGAVVDIIPAARTAADQEADLLALVEILRRLGGSCLQTGQQADACKRKSRQADLHACLR